MAAIDLFKAADALSMAWDKPNANKTKIRNDAENLRRHSEDIINDTTRVSTHTDKNNNVTVKVNQPGVTKPVAIAKAPPPKVKAAPSAAEAAEDPKKADARAKHLARPRDEDGRIIPDAPSGKTQDTGKTPDTSGASIDEALDLITGDTEATVDAKVKIKDEIKATVNQYSDEYDAQSEAEGLNDKNFQEYILNNPDLREHSEALGLYGADAADWGRWHYYTFGIKEPRTNTPHEIKDPSLRNQTWAQTEIPQVYKDIGIKLGIPMNTLNDVFRYSVRTMTPSELWETRADIDPEWNLAGRGGLLGEEGFDPTGWRYEADKPYAEGLLGDTLLLNKDRPGGKPIGQLVDEEDLRFIQDRFNDAFISGDFPEGWIDQNDKWQGPEGLEGYWNILTNAYRDEAGNLRTSVDRPPEGWFGYQPLTGLGPRGNINRGGQPFNQTGVPTYGPGSRGLGGSGEYLFTPYTRPALQDWSHLAPPQGPGLLGTAPAQRALLANNLANYQPWAQGGVIDYAPRGGSAWAPRTYSTTSPPRLPATTATPDTGSTVPPQVYNLPGGGTTTDFGEWTMAKHNLNYPGRVDLANELGYGGLNYFTPEAAAWRASLDNGQIPQATPAGTVIPGNAVFNAGRGATQGGPSILDYSQYDFG